MLYGFISLMVVAISQCRQKLLIKMLNYFLYDLIAETLTFKICAGEILCSNEYRAYIRITFVVVYIANLFINWFVVV